MSRRLLAVLVSGALALAAAAEVPITTPLRPRPFFMPDEKRKEILELVRTQPWAKERYEALKAAARAVRTAPWSGPCPGHAVGPA